MKKQTVNLSWPAKISSFTQDGAHENFSRAKLRVFYKGETGDHRFFSDEFCEEIVKTLPYTPVVSYYDSEKDDFVGHATEQQILGIVDPCRPYTFEVGEDGNNWCVCDIVLYTERPDMVGTLAKKIEGHSQSLELDPNSVEYVINYDEKKHFKNIEFTAGKFVGVSVLGNDQKPAFTGSHFFTVDESFEDKMQMLKDYCESAIEGHSDEGENHMDLHEFMKLSWGDVAAKVDEAICKEYEKDAWTSIVDMFDDSAIVHFCYYVEGTCKLMRVKYSCSEDGTVQLGDVNEVHVTYEDVEPVTDAAINVESVIENATSQVEEMKASDEEPKEDEEEVCPVCGHNPCTCDPVDHEKHDDEEEEDEDEHCDCVAETPVEKASAKVADAEEQSPELVDAAQTDYAEITPELSEKVSEVVDEQIAQEDTSASSFAESERAELEILKREKKVAMIDSYKDSLTEEEYTNFVSKVDEYDNDKLELELLKAYKRSTSEPKTIRAFAFTPTANNAIEESSTDAYIRRMRRK